MIDRWREGGRGDRWREGWRDRQVMFVIKY